jgi:hypothetical protein
MFNHSSHSNKMLAVFLGCALAGSAGIGIASSARAADAEAVTIDTSFTVHTPPVRLENPPGSTASIGAVELRVSGSAVFENQAKPA